MNNDSEILNFQIKSCLVHEHKKTCLILFIEQFNKKQTHHAKQILDYQQFINIKYDGKNVQIKEIRRIFIKSIIALTLTCFGLNDHIQSATLHQTFIAKVALVRCLTISEAK